MPFNWILNWKGGKRDGPVVGPVLAPLLCPVESHSSQGAGQLCRCQELIHPPIEPAVVMSSATAFECWSSVAMLPM